MKLLFLFITAIASAQVFQPLGTPSDPCIGGNIWPVPQLHFGNFYCTFNMGTPGTYQVTLGLVEPYGTTKVGGRVFNVLVNGNSIPTFQGIDIMALGGSTNSLTLLSAVVTTANGVISVQPVTTTRSAVLSSITILSVGPAGSGGVTTNNGTPLNYTETHHQDVDPIGYSKVIAHAGNWRDGAPITGLNVSYYLVPGGLQTGAWYFWFDYGPIVRVVVNGSDRTDYMSIAGNVIMFLADDMQAGDIVEVYRQ